MPAPTLTAIFVYGTLKRGHCRAYALGGQRFAAEVVTAPRYRLLDCGDYPGLIDAGMGAGVAVEGELWLVEPVCLAQLDQIECVDAGLFERRPVELHGSPHDGDVHGYFYLGDTNGLRDCGARWIGE